MSRILLIDNYDSFTFNLVQAFRSLGASVDVIRNDRIDVPEALARPATHLVISPGPGTPADAGVSLPLVEAALGRMPILGVCLGHQCLAIAAGGTVVRGAQMHGKASPLRHDGRGIFAGLPQEVSVGRYHSLVVEDPGALTVTARTSDGTVMAVRDEVNRAVGVQFHPESILTPDGPAMLRHFLTTRRVEVAA